MIPLPKKREPDGAELSAFGEGAAVGVSELQALCSAIGVSELRANVSAVGLPQRRAVGATASVSEHRALGDRVRQRPQRRLRALDDGAVDLEESEPRPALVRVRESAGPRAASPCAR